MATIEPRLIHLLNESTTPQLSHTDLPSIHALHLPTSDRSISHGDADGAYRGDFASLEGHAKDFLQPVDDGTPPSHRRSERHRDGHYAVPTAVHPLQLLLSDPSEPSSAQAGRLGEDLPESLDDASKKRSRTMPSKDDFVQLPQPVKKQKASEKARYTTPIIKPLLEPPPHAALFPPISSTTFTEKHKARSSSSKTSERRGSSRSSPPESQNGSSGGETSSGKGRKRATKPRRKWSEEETKHLLLGVHRHGVGKWTSILDDPDFSFNERTAGDLKDRFRTCCPDELRRSKKSAGKHSSQSSVQEWQGRRDYDQQTSQFAALQDDDRLGASTSSEATPRAKKSRAHRKNLDDLAELGIYGPFKKSHRRERRPFTDQDDREILEGLDLYGPAWTKIQRDSRFNLSRRQPTDLRDRVRNKYPAIYQRIEKGTFQARDGAKSNGILEPSVNMPVEQTPHRSKHSPPASSHARHMSRDGTRFAPQVFESPDTSHTIQAMDGGDTIAPAFIAGEMDISRLLLDDSKMSVQGGSR